jgi:hypothetical protein
LRLISCVALGGIGASCSRAPEAGTPAYELTDLTGAYVAFVDRTENLGTAERVAAFKADMAARLPGFYDATRMPGVTHEAYDADIARSFADFPERRDAFLRAAASFRSMLQPAIESFALTFTDAHSLGHIALLHSLGEMDAGTRTLRGESYLVFGADVMARLHTSGAERPFFHHELFHVYNGQFFGDCDRLWCALWSEGLAVYASERLNPGASDADLLLTAPRPIRTAVDAKLERAVCALRARLDSTAQADYASFFLGDSSFEDLPPRSGYYVGYRALRQAAERQPLNALARLDQAQARFALEAALSALATCT